MKSIRLGLCLVLLATFPICALAARRDTDADAARAQALHLFDIFKTRDWKGLFDVIEVSKATAKTMTNRDQFAVDFQKGLTGGDPQGDFAKLMDSMADNIVGAAIIEGNKAYVATSCTVLVDSTKVRFLGLAKLLKVDGVWRWDLSFTDDMSKASEQRFTELLGTPSKT